jgi:3-hydroxy-3-methylglutaryl CoA synthase
MTTKSAGRDKLNDSESVKIGINMMVVISPTTYMSSSELSKVTGEEVSKIEHFGVKKQRLPTLSQSNMTMVADAIYEFIKRVSAWPDIEAKFFAEPPKHIHFGTESNDDFSRPEVTPALGMALSKLLNEDEARYRKYLNVFRETEPGQRTFACAGGGLAMSDAVAEVKVAHDFGRSESEIIITADTAVYDPTRAKNAEKTQGAAATLMWITKDPELVEIKYSRGYGRFSMPFPDFTKFGYNTPKVYGEASNIAYIYAVAQAVEKLEAAYSAKPEAVNVLLRSNVIPERIKSVIGSITKKINPGIDGVSFSNMYAFVSHVPYPKQARESAGYLFAHYLKRFNPKLLDDIQKRDGVGADPLEGRKLTDVITEKLASFSGSREKDLVGYLENDKEIKAELAWVKRLMKQQEFDAFIDRLHINEALELPSVVGNSYTTSLPVALASLLRHVTDSHHNVEEPKHAVLAFYGSGLVAKAFLVEIKATQRSREHLIISMERNQDIPISADQYVQLHTRLVRGDAMRTMTDGSLVEMNMNFLDGRLPRGFNLVRRHSDGTWEGVYVDGDGKQRDVVPRF